MFDDHPMETPEEFLRFVLTPEPVERASRLWIYRGVGSEHHELVPSALREPNREQLHLLCPVETDRFDEFFQRISEWGLLIKFRDRLTTSGLPMPTGTSPFLVGRAGDLFEAEDTVTKPWPTDVWIALAALAQHSGLPTRLLDWTHDALTATYFAASNAMQRLHQADDSSERLAVWMLSRSQALVDRRLEIVVPPYNENANLHAQRGLFSVWRSQIDPEAPGEIDRRPIDAIVASANGADWISPFKRVTLPIKFAPNLLVDLERRGVQAATLFPSYEGAVRAMQEISVASEWLDEQVRSL